MSVSPQKMRMCTLDLTPVGNSKRLRVSCIIMSGEGPVCITEAESLTFHSTCPATNFQVHRLNLALEANAAGVWKSHLHHLIPLLFFSLSPYN